MGSLRYSLNQEVIRNEVNAWVRTYNGFDYVVDFDEATRADSDPSRLKVAYDCGDHLHPSSEGGKAMVEAFDIARFPLYHSKMQEQNCV